ncbi:hypothetical protein HA402_008864 [Bradysia odoriphaga]|nr:hypothetical protein HA402_008864 [Bradysia odoriphaga]
MDREAFKAAILAGNPITDEDVFENVDVYVDYVSDMVRNMNHFMDSLDPLNELLDLERQVDHVEDEPNTIDHIMELRANFFTPTPREVIDARIAPLIANAPEPNITEREITDDGYDDDFWGDFFDGISDDESGFVQPDDNSDMHIQPGGGGEPPGGGGEPPGGGGEQPGGGGEQPGGGDEQPGGGGEQPGGGDEQPGGGGEQPGGGGEPPGGSGEQPGGGGEQPGGGGEQPGGGGEQPGGGGEQPGGGGEQPGGGGEQPGGGGEQPGGGGEQPGGGGEQPGGGGEQPGGGGEQPGGGGEQPGGGGEPPGGDGGYDGDNEITINPNQDQSENTTGRTTTDESSNTTGQFGHISNTESGEEDDGTRGGNGGPGGVNGGTGGVNGHPVVGGPIIIYDRPPIITGIIVRPPRDFECESLPRLYIPHPHTPTPPRPPRRPPPSSSSESTLRRTTIPPSSSETPETPDTRPLLREEIFPDLPDEFEESNEFIQTRPVVHRTTTAVVTVPNLTTSGTVPNITTGVTAPDLTTGVTAREFIEVHEAQVLIMKVLNQESTAQFFRRRTSDHSKKAFMLFCNMWCLKIFSVRIEEGDGNYTILLRNNHSA